VRRKGPSDIDLAQRGIGFVSINGSASRPVNSHLLTASSAKKGLMHCRAWTVTIAHLALLPFLCAIPTTAQNNPCHYVANTRPPDAFLALRTHPTARQGTRTKVMPNAYWQGEAVWYLISTMLVSRRVHGTR
jgi:hypothetical protein